MNPPDKGRQGKSFGRFQLILEMARGGMATLYLARLTGPEQFEKLLVVKRIHEHQAQDESFIRMFLDEARIAALIQHPNVATVFDLGQHEGVFFLAMEYIHGQNMAEIVRSASRRPGVLHWSHAARMVADAAAGLHGAHEASGDRDVSPQNILVSYGGHVKVVDFGIALAAERLTHTAVGTLKGKVAYMSPEQVCMEPIDRRSDIFSLGIVLFEATCRKRLFKQEHEAATILRVRDANVPRPRTVNPEIPASLERVMLKALAKRPKDRFSTAGELEAAIEQVLHGTGHPMGHRQIAPLMESLFHDVKRLKDQQIRAALEDTDADVPLRAVGMGANPSYSHTEMPGSTVLQRPPSTWRWRLLLLGGIVVVTAATVFLVLRPGSDPASDGGRTGAARPTPPPAARASPREGPRVTQLPSKGSAARARDTGSQGDASRLPARPVTLRISIRPRVARAVVRFRGLRYWGSDFRIQVPRADQTEIVEIQAPGYRTVKEELRLSRDVHRTLTLRRLRIRPRVRPGTMRPTMKSAADLAKELPK
jgi:serine/threonine-protein kinase